MRIHGKIFVVTGGGSGIGREVVRQLIARGGRVAAFDVREESLAATAALVVDPERLTTHVVDVSDKAAVVAAIDEVLAVHGAIDGLLNVAGVIQPFVDVLELDQDVIDKVMNVNFFGVLNTVQATLPELLKRPEGACLINVSSMGALSPVPGQAIYGASKAAVKLMTEALYGELRDTQVAVSIVFPGAIDTPIVDNSHVSVDFKVDKEPKMTSAADAAGTIIDAGVEKGRFRVLIGIDAMGLDVLSRVAPRLTNDIVAKKMAQLRP